MLEEIGTMKTFEDGQTIFKQGEIAHEMYIVAQGGVKIFRERQGKETKLATLKPEDFFGEMALFEDTRRSASAVATGKTELQVIEKDDFMRMLKEPVAWMVMERMAHRIREVDEKLEELSVSDQVRKEHIASISVRSHWFE